MSEDRRTFREMQNNINENKKKTKAENHLLEEKKKDFYGDCDHPSTMENGTATILWIGAMVVSLLFKGGWALCIFETIVWWKFITRHK